MKKTILLSATILMILINNTVFAQTVAWSLAYETFTLPTADAPAFAGKADYDANGNLYVAGRSNSTASYVTIDKVNPAGTVVTSVTFPSTTTLNLVKKVKVFRNEFGANYVYVLFATSVTGSSPNALRLLKYDTDLNLLNTLEIIPTSPPYSPVTPWLLDVDPISGNAVISYTQNHINKISRMNPDLTIEWTRSFPNPVPYGPVWFKSCPTNNWIAVISGDGLQRISAANVIEWTATGVTSATALDISGAGDIYCSTGIVLKKYSATGVLGFISVYSGTSSTAAFIKTSSFGGALIVFNASGTTRIKYFNFTGGSPWGSVVSSPALSLTGLEEIDGNAFISANKRTIITLGSDVRDSSLLIKYSAAGTLIYRDAFSVPTPPVPSFTGIVGLGITRYKSQITVYGTQKDYEPAPNHTQSWYLRTYAPMARLASAETEINGLNLSAYPNPTAGNVRISSESEINEINIYDLTGRLVKSLEVDYLFETDIDVSSLKPGIYLLMAATHEKQTSIKLVKQ